MHRYPSNEKDVERQVLLSFELILPEWFLKPIVKRSKMEAVLEAVSQTTEEVLF